MNLNETELQKRINFVPHKYQQEVLDGMKRFNTICAGTRFGKSRLCAYIALRELLIPNRRIWVVAPTYDLTKKIYAHLATMMGNAYPQLLKDGAVRMSDRSGSMRVDFKPIGSWLELKSAENPTSLLGEELDLLIVDECSRIKEEVWTGYLYSRLTSRKGRAVFISTPFGKNWFYKEWIKGKDPLKPEYASFHYTSLDNPYFTQEEWDNAKRNLPEQSFKQEHLAVFLDDAASFFRRVRDVISGKLEDKKIGHYYVMGVDLGKYKDFTVLTVIDRANHHVVAFDRFNQLDWNFQKSRIYEMAKRYGGARILIDSTGLGDPIADDLRRMGLAIDDFKYTNKAKEQLLEKLSISIEQKRISYPPIEVMLDELESFGYERTDSGRYKYSAPEGMYDDCVNSLALAVWPLPERPTSAGDSTPILPNTNIY
jgi:phage terminase large subunit-like protein